MENVNYDNIHSLIQELESSIEKTCLCFSYRSIVEKILTDLCVSHHAYLSKKTSGLLFPIKIEDKMTFDLFLPSFMQVPHYIACFSTHNSDIKKTIPENTYGRLRNAVGLWLFLTEIRYTGLLGYFELLRLNPKTLKNEMVFNPVKFSSAVSEFRDFFIRYADYEATRTESILPKIFSLALEDISEVDRLILREKGFSPSSVLKAFYALGHEWGEIFKLPETYIAARGFKKGVQEFCPVLIDFPMEYCQRILKKIEVKDVSETLDRITLTPVRAAKYVQSRKARKRDQDIFMHSYPLWDYPLLKIDQNYVTHIVLLVQCLQELAYKFITTSKKALGRYTRNQHKKLVQEVISVLKEEGFIDVRSNVKMKEQDQDVAQFDIIAVEKPYLLHVECKTKRTPWRRRMFLNPLELRKEGLDFTKYSKLSLANWNERLRHLNEYAGRALDGNGYELVNLVVTDTPIPASITCKHIDIIWVKSLKDHIRKIMKR